MGRRYHCDYCGKSFPDNANNRKKHVRGVHHIRLRKLHYESFRDALTVLQAEAQKKPCRRFLQTGYCDYGAACKFSHLSAEETQRLTEQADVESKKMVRQALMEDIGDQNFSLIIDESTDISVSKQLGVVVKFPSPKQTPGFHGYSGGMAQGTWTEQ